MDCPIAESEGKRALKSTKKGRKPTSGFLPCQRKVRDSNPRYPKGVYRISSPARSITLPTFQLKKRKRKIRFAEQEEGTATEPSLNMDAKVMLKNDNSKQFVYFLFKRQF